MKGNIEIMPFGKYKGKPMSEVPASYFHWLWTNGKQHEVGRDSVADYIKENLDHLEREYPDGIWE